VEILISCVQYCFAIDDECYSRWCDLDGLKFREWRHVEFIEVLPVMFCVVRV
jgi:hypothetical protein